MKKRHTILIDEGKLKEVRRLTGKEGRREISVIFNNALDQLIKKERVQRHLNRFEGKL